MIRVVLSTVVLAGLAAPALAQDLVKQIDAQGRTVYADRALKGSRVVGEVDPSAAPAVSNVPVPVQPAGLQSTPRAAPARPVEPQMQAQASRTAASAGPRRSEVRWAGETSGAPGSVNAAYVEIEAARAASEEAEARLRSAVVPLPGETVKRADGSMRYLPAYYERVAPFERDAMLAQERLERADAGLRVAR